MSSKEFCSIFICISKVLDRFLYSEHPFGCSGKSSVKSSVFFTLNNIFPTPARDGLCVVPVLFGLESVRVGASLAFM